MHLKIVYVLGVSHNLLLLCAANWQEELHKYISPDQLPQAYGGTRCEPDPWCTDYVSIHILLSELDPSVPVCSKGSILLSLSLTTTLVMFLPSTI